MKISSGEPGGHHFLSSELIAPLVQEVNGTIVECNTAYDGGRAMEELYREGRVRAIGLSNFHFDRVMDMIVHHRVAPAVNQIETHPFNQQIDTQKFLRDNRVQIESWGLFAQVKHSIFQNELLVSLAGKYIKTVA